MKIFIDTEFNGWNGELISMALVAEDGGEFYEVLELPTLIDPWVEEHVVPFLDKDFITQTEFQGKLKKFLKGYEDITIIADWPDDIAYFTKALITGPGRGLSIRRPVNMRIDYELTSTKSEVPHNALWDARAIQESYNDAK